MNRDELIESCIVQNRVAQKVLYDQYKDAMYTLAFRMSGRFELADDALQMSFVKIFKNLSKLKDHKTLPAWIKMIVVRTCLELIKKEKRYSTEITSLTTIKREHTCGQSDTGYIEKAIASLPQGYKTVFVLIEIEGYSHKEVAGELGISENTSKSQLSRAKAKLRDKLIEYR